MWSLPPEKGEKYDFLSDRAGLFIRRGGKDELFWEPLVERPLEEWDTQRDFFHAALDGVDFLSVKVKAAPKPALDDTCAGLLAQLEQADKVTRRAADAAAKQAEADMRAEAAAKSSGKSSGKSSKAGKAGKSSKAA